jgi:putative addiction module CopG family antidote
MTISLPAFLEEFVRRKVAAGEFHSSDEVVCEGLRLLQEQEAWRNEARHKIDVGWEQAKAGQLRTPPQARKNLTVRKKAWKSSRGR